MNKSTLKVMGFALVAVAIANRIPAARALIGS